MVPACDAFPSWHGKSPRRSTSRGKAREGEEGLCCQARRHFSQLVACCSSKPYAVAFDSMLKDTAEIASGLQNAACNNTLMLRRLPTVWLATRGALSTRHSLWWLPGAVVSQASSSSIHSMGNASSCKSGIKILLNVLCFPFIDPNHFSGLAAFQNQLWQCCVGMRNAQAPVCRCLPLHKFLNVWKVPDPLAYHSG